MNIHHDTNFNQKQLDSLIAHINKYSEIDESEIIITEGGGYVLAGMVPLSYIYTKDYLFGIHLTPILEPDTEEIIFPGEVKTRDFNNEEAHSGSLLALYFDTDSVPMEIVNYDELYLCDCVKKLKFDYFDKISINEDKITGLTYHGNSLSNKTLNSPQIAEHMGYDQLNLYFKNELIKDGKFINLEIEKLFKNHYKRRVFQNTELDENGFPTGYDQQLEEYWYKDFAITTRINSKFTAILRDLHPEKF
tara:strand:+ start:45 stop:788 length:744 start_codon:yes stop_codon:yes gene_type:complete